MELLIVILIIVIFSGAIFSIYWNIVREQKTQRVTVQKERELLDLQNYLRKLLGSIGFGMPSSFLKNAVVACTDNNLASFKSQNATIGVAKNCPVSDGPNSDGPNHDKIYFRSLYATGSRKAGCWWIFDQAGNISSMGVDKYGRVCEIETDDTCVFLDSFKNFLGNGSCINPNSFCTQRTPCFMFFFNSTSDNASTPSVFRLHLDNLDSNDTAQRQRCAPGSAKLILQREWNLSAIPIFDCVGGMTFDFVGNSTSSVPRAIRLCLLVQVSGRLSSPRDIPSTPTCSFNTTNAEWKYYRWRIIEEIIPLENVRF